jgi:hypothetical protein
MGSVVEDLVGDCEIAGDDVLLGVTPVSPAKTFNIQREPVALVAMALMQCETCNVCPR